MTLKQQLEDAVGKSIDRICPNRFHDFSKNHCAHFVSHLLKLEFSFNCKELAGGNEKGANIRVHEVFSKCPRVGKFENRPADSPVLVFVTRRDVVDLENKKMLNIPQKHIGVLQDGNVYHYSNSQEKVVKWTPEKFLSTFQEVYDGIQALFFGTFPNSDIVLNVDSTGTSVTEGIAFELKRESDKRWLARAINDADDDWFYVGREIKNNAQDFHGIFQKTSEYYGPKFNYADYLLKLDHWAYLLHATGYCESKNHFNLYNTYDRAKFTYGFYQLAAHTPNDNLILLFRQLVNLPKAKQYFPDLKLVNGKLHRVGNDGSSTNLEEVMQTGPNNADQLQLFMNYLNPNRRTIEEQEVLQAARLMHWTVNDPAFKQLQVIVAAEILQRKMAKFYNNWYDLDGKPDTICALIADIHHQGRAKKTKVAAALNTSDPEKALLNISSATAYAGRQADLKDIINQLKNVPNGLGHKKYDAANNEFI